MNWYFVGIMYNEVNWDWKVNCFDERIGTNSQSLSSSCLIGFIKGGQAPDSIKGLSAVISGYFLFWDLALTWSTCSIGIVSMGSWEFEQELLTSLTFCWVVIFKGDASNSEGLELRHQLQARIPFFKLACFCRAKIMIITFDYTVSNSKEKFRYVFSIH